MQERVELLDSKRLRELECTVIILSATLTERRRRELLGLAALNVAARIDFDAMRRVKTTFIGRDFREEEDDYLDLLDHLHDWMSAQEEGAFGLLWEKMTDEVFHLLFGNRGFLLNFSLALAQFRQERGDLPSPRCSIPQWVKRAVYFNTSEKTANAPFARKTSPALSRLTRSSIMTTSCL